MVPNCKIRKNEANVSLRAKLLYMFIFIDRIDNSCKS